MTGPDQSIQPSNGATRRVRRRLGWRHEVLLALLPTATILLVLALVEGFSHQRLLFASLASSAFLIYLDPHHGTNSTRTLLIAQPGAALAAGFAAYFAFGVGYAAAAAAMLLTIVLMIVCDAAHPPAVSTSLAFAFRAGPESDLVIFALAVGLVALLVLLERSTLWLLTRIGEQ